jgi:DNA invertase Pin-like site-specific DNA recombinase
MLAAYVQRAPGAQNQKVTASQVAEIRARRSQGESAEAIALAYGISKWNVYTIVQRRSWAHVK